MARRFPWAAVAALAAHAAGVAAQWPSLSGFFGGGSAPAPPQDVVSQPGVGQDATQRAVEGIASLMQQFERLQPRLQQLPEQELRDIALRSEALHERFLEMQRGLGSLTSLPDLEEERILEYHRDLAAFVGEVSQRLGNLGEAGASGGGFGGGFGGAPRGAAPFGQAAGRFGGGGAAAGAAFGGGGATPGGSFGAGAASGGDMDGRLQTAMQSIAGGMQRFEALHPRLRQLPPQVFGQIANDGQALHERFLVLQRKGVELAGDGRQPPNGPEVAAYLSGLEAFVPELLSFVQQAEQQASSGASPLGGVPLGGFSGGFAAGGAAAATPGGGRPFGQSIPGFAAGGPAAPAIPPTAPGGTVRMPPMQGAAAGAGGQITPETDRRLSEVISQVTGMMQEFEGIRPRLAQLPAQALQPIASRGQQLHERFVALQSRGASLAGDGTRPMSEADAAKYASDMAAFHSDQRAYVESARQVLQGGGGGGAGAFPTMSPPGGGPLPGRFGTAGAASPPPIGAARGALGPRSSEELSKAIFCEGPRPGASPPLGAQGSGTFGGLRELGGVALDVGVFPK